MNKKIQIQIKSILDYLNKSENDGWQDFDGTFMKSNIDKKDEKIVLAFLETNNYIETKGAIGNDYILICITNEGRLYLANLN